MQKITCEACGKSFQADDQVKKAFCVHCGHANEIMDSSADMELSEEEVKYKEWKEQLEKARFKIIRKKTGEKGDIFLGFWMMLMFHARNSRGSFRINRVVKEVNSFWQQAGLADVIEVAGAQAEKLVSEQLYDSAHVYYLTCQQDRHYGSKMLNLVKLKPDQLAAKTANEISELIFRFWLQLPSLRFREQIFRAAWFAFAPSFTDYSDALARSVSNLPEKDRVALGEIIGVPL